MTTPDWMPKPLPLPASFWLESNTETILVGLREWADAHALAAYRAGQESMRDKLDQQWNAGFDQGKVAGAKMMRERATEVCAAMGNADSIRALPLEDQP